MSARGGSVFGGKKLLFIASALVLLAAGCSASQPTSQTTPPANNQQQTATPPADQPNQTYENEFIKVTVPAGWTAKQANKTITYRNCANKENCTSANKVEPNPAAVNITKGNYILYINVQASQASGVIGGRFAEIAGGAPSADAVVVDWPNECGSAAYYPAFAEHQRVDLYVGAGGKSQSCRVPANGSTVWFFSYITDNGRGYFNYYNRDGSGSDGYVITMAYNSKDVNKLPKKGSTELNSFLDEMTGITKTLEIKKH